MKLFLAGFFMLLFASVTAQVQYIPGPALKNDRDIKMNRMLEGDDNNFYCFRIRSKGKGTSFFVEKFDNKKLEPVFSKEIPFATEEERMRLEDVFYANNYVYIFESQYDKAADKMTLYCQTVSSTGQLADKLVPVTSFNTDHYQFSDFDIFQNPSKTKFVIKSSHKASKKEEYSTDFVVLETKAGPKVQWTKSVNQELTNRLNMAPLKSNQDVPIIKDASFIGLNFDDKDNIYYCYAEEAEASSKDEQARRFFLATIKSEDKKPRKTELKFDKEYTVYDIKILQRGDSEVVAAGYVKNDPDNKNPGSLKTAFFSYRINVISNSVTSKLVHIFDDQLMKALETARPENQLRRLYKLDYIFPIGDATYYVGEQYLETHMDYRPNFSDGYNWGYKYMDVIVTKINASGRVEWVKNVPVERDFFAANKHVLKEYIAVPAEKNIYIFCNDHPDNMKFYKDDNYKPSDLKTVSNVQGSNFASNQINLANGSLTRSVAFENKTYCFEPVLEDYIQFYSKASCELFVQGSNNQIYIYTRDKDHDQFGTLKFKP